MSLYHDVIVVGAGPAGSTLGYELASAGRDVLVLEKARLPRYKPCAGGVTVKAAGILGLDLHSVVQQTIYGVRVFHRKKPEFTRRYHQPLVYMVMRDQFDMLLTQRAREAGAVIADGQEVKAVRHTSDGFEVESSGGFFRCKVLAGADGAGSRVARSLGLAQADHHAGVVAEAALPGGASGNWDSLMGIDMGNLRYGYGWVFPKSECLTTGIGGRRCDAGKLKQRYAEMMTRLELTAPASIKSHPLPVLRKGSRLHCRGALVLGDAAGLLDFVTGEGIHNAVRSAQIAAPVINRALATGDGDLSDYQVQVAVEILPELRAARALARTFAWFPGLCFRSIERNDRLWRASCRLIRGEESYRSLRARLGVLRPIYDLLCL